jgi:hypothetical protein
VEDARAVVAAIGGFVFIIAFVLMAPGPRAALVAAGAGLTAFLNSWAPYSFVVLGFVVVAPLASVVLLKTWPAHKEPENPMAKYRRHTVDEE